nr:tail assembly protein [Kangiellaceae bacterium]
MTSFQNDISDTIAGSLNINSLFHVNTQMILGHYRFCISNASYQTLKRQTHYDWQAVHRLGIEPAMQYTSKGAETIELEGVVYPEYQGGLSQVTFMRSEAGTGKPLLLIAGNGFTFGRWCITSINETHSTFLSDGTPRKIEFSLRLKAYGEDKASGLQGIIQTTVATR